MADVLRAQAGGLTPQTPVPQSQMQTPQAASVPTDEMWTQRPNEAAAQVADARVQALLNPALAGLQTFAAQNAQTIQALAEQKFADDYKRWGPEINGYISQIPVERRTLDSLEKVVKFVRGNHVDELASERARQMLANGQGLGERSTGAAGVQINSNPFDVNKLSDGQRKLMEHHGIAPSEVVDFCRRTNMPIEKWVENANGGKLFTSASPFQIQLKEESLGISRRFD